MLGIAPILMIYCMGWWVVIPKRNNSSGIYAGLNFGYGETNVRMLLGSLSVMVGGPSNWFFHGH